MLKVRRTRSALRTWGRSGARTGLAALQAAPIISEVAAGRSSASNAVSPPCAAHEAARCRQTGIAHQAVNPTPISKPRAQRIQPARGRAVDNSHPRE